MSYDWIEPRRGTIYDRNGVVLATSVESTTIYIDPVEVDDADATAQVLVDVLGGQKSDYLEAITAPNTRYAVVKEKADVAVGDALKERVRELSASGGSREGMDFGIRYKTLWKREYPNAQVGGQVIGVCTLETDAENNREYYKGVSGLELYYDDVLSGEAGYTREERSPDGTPIPGGTRDSKAPWNGEDIIISIDIELQQSVEERLTADAKGITANGGQRHRDGRRPRERFYAAAIAAAAQSGRPDEYGSGCAEAQMRDRPVRAGLHLQVGVGHGHPGSLAP